jgi:guanylate kinase
MRMAKAAQELARAQEFDVIITNDNLEIALQEAEAIVSDFIEN